MADPIGAAMLGGKKRSGFIGFTKLSFKYCPSFNAHWSNFVPFFITDFLGGNTALGL
jgi:hypothetical protein